MLQIVSLFDININWRTPDAIPFCILEVSFSKLLAIITELFYFPQLFKDIFPPPSTSPQISKS